MGVSQVTSEGHLSISNSVFNAILETSAYTGGRVFYIESSGNATLSNVSGNITGNWKSWCGE